MAKPLVKCLDILLSDSLLSAQGYRIIKSCGTIQMLEGFDLYNNLITINSFFSTEPKFHPQDRTELAHGAVKFASVRAWKAPVTQIDLATAMQQRVKEITDYKVPVNIMWSGGIDSTSVLVAFIKYAPDLKQCRVIYSPWSCYEHPDFFQLLRTMPDIELVDISGTTYLDLQLDGIYVSGNTGDEMHASLDKSFFDAVGFDGLQRSWQDFFVSKGASDKLIEFCEKHFDAAGKDIVTVLDARWWFYASCKLTSVLYANDLTMLCSSNRLFDPQRLVGFFDSDSYESYIYFNTDKIIPSDNYATWKQHLKNFCFEFDGLENWCKNKTKFHSAQTRIYGLKKQLLNNQRALLWLEDGSSVITPSLPFFSKNEWDSVKDPYQYLFRMPNGHYE